MYVIEEYMKILNTSFNWIKTCIFQKKCKYKLNWELKTLELVR
jgi:hypothetical protein